MRCVVQRVSEANVIVDNNVVGEIQNGLVVLLGIETTDTGDDVLWLAKKVVQMRIFSDNDGKMNLSIQDVGGNVLLISQFTLHASTEKGNRPSFVKAARPGQAIPLYERMIALVENLIQKKPATGIFGADMKVHLVNDGPVTIWLDSKNKE